MVKAQVNVQDQQEHYSHVVKGGFKTGMMALGTGTVGAIGLQRMNVAAWRGLTLPLKAFALTSITTAGFIIGADSASRKYELSKYSLGSGTKLEKISHEQQRLEQEAGISSSGGGRGGNEIREVGTKDALLNWAKQNRWSVVFGSWVASMAGSGAYIAATPLSFAQKLVQARMVAQSATVALVLASAVLTQIPNADGLSDDEVKRIDREQGMYAWKKDSPHEKEKAKEHQQAQQKA